MRNERGGQVRVGGRGESTRESRREEEREKVFVDANLALTEWREVRVHSKREGRERDSHIRVKFSQSWETCICPV